MSIKTKEVSVKIKNYISDVIDVSCTQQGAFNIIVAGCGTGKSHWVKYHLREYYPNIDPANILIVTSRALTRDQQVDNQNLNKYDKKILTYWNGDEENYESTGASIACYGDIIEALSHGTAQGHEALERVEIIVFDECHALFADEFIDDMKWMRAWIAKQLSGQQKIIYGLTATPGIIDYWCKRNRWGVTINKMNKIPISGYQAKQMICTDFDTIPYLIATDRLPGRTIILCASVADCYKLNKKIPNSAVLISSRNKHYDKETMFPLRAFIIKSGSLPATCLRRVSNDKVERIPLDVLICTSTAREGFNLRENSGVRNVICCLTDEMHVTQFAGRCRYNLDNIVVAKTYIRSDNMKHQDDYIIHSRNLFRDYLDNVDTTRWFDSVSHLVEHDVYGVKQFIMGSNALAFIDYINSRWLVPPNCKDISKYRIWKESDKAAIVRKAEQTKLLDNSVHAITFVGVVRALRDTLGYVVDDGRANIKGVQQRYKLVVSFDEDKITYTPVKKSIDK